MAKSAPFAKKPPKGAKPGKPGKPMPPWMKKAPEKKMKSGGKVC